MDIPRFLRRSEARELLNVNERQFKKLVKAKAVTPRYWPGDEKKQRKCALYVERELISLKCRVAEGRI